MAIRLLTAALLSACCLAPAFAAPVEYAIDPNHSQVIFGWNHFGFSNIRARFNVVEGSFVYDAENPSASSVRASVAIESVDSGVEKLDAHLKSPDFFDLAKFGKAEFQSTKVEAAGDGKLALTGDLTIHGVSKPVTFQVSVNKVGEHAMKKMPAAGFDARTTVKRSDFGMPMAVPNVSDEITIDVTVEAFAKPDA